MGKTIGEAMKAHQTRRLNMVARAQAREREAREALDRAAAEHIQKVALKSDGRSWLARFIEWLRA
jgi:hypothetical protein